MRKPLVPVFVSLFVVAVPALAPAFGDDVTTRQVEAARRCAIETRVASRAFRDVSDSVQAGGSARARALLDSAEEALASARRACIADGDVLAHLDLLERDAEALRRVLATAPPR